MKYETVPVTVIDNAYLRQNASSELSSAFPDIALALKKQESLDEITWTVKVFLTRATAAPGTMSKVVGTALSSMSMKSIDLLVLSLPERFPRQSSTLIDLWRELEQSVASKCVKQLGVADFSADDLAYLLRHSQVKPAVNQVEPENATRELFALAKTHDIELFSHASYDSKINALEENKKLSGLGDDIPWLLRYTGIIDSRSTVVSSGYLVPSLPKQATSTPAPLTTPQPTKKVFILHDNESWLPPFYENFERLGIEFEAWNLGNGGAIDLNGVPPEGIYFNRVSPSSHTRGQRFSLEYATTVIEWLELHGRRIVNGVEALQMEISKVRQQSRLEMAGIRTPKTWIVNGTGPELHQRLIETAEKSGLQGFMVKINRGGSGSGVELFNSIDELKMFLEGGMLEEALDATYLLQEFIAAPDRKITRMEFVGGKFVYGVRVDTSEGFNLCAAEVCQRPRKNQGPKYEITTEAHALIPKYEAFLKKYKMEVAGIEFVTDAEGTTYTYDVNSNTNYNPQTESTAFGDNFEKFAAYRLGQYLIQVMHE